jgi:hypothetical protein
MKEIGSRLKGFRVQDLGFRVQDLGIEHGDWDGFLESYSPASSANLKPKL